MTTQTLTGSYPGRDRPRIVQPLHGDAGGTLTFKLLTVSTSGHDLSSGPRANDNTERAKPRASDLASDNTVTEPATRTAAIGSGNFERPSWSQQHSALATWQSTTHYNTVTAPHNAVRVSDG